MIKETINIQGGILKGHGREYCGYLFLRLSTDISGGQKAKLKHWINVFTEKYMTTFKKQEQETDAFKDHGTQFPVITIGFTYSGLNSLVDEQIPMFSEDFIFRDGMSHPVTKTSLNDYMVDYDPEFNPDVRLPKIGLVVMVAGASTKIVEESIAEIKEIKEFSELFEPSELIFGFKGVSSTEENATVGPLGYADGLSESRSIEKLLEDICLVDHQQTSSPSYGSFLAFRKLEINRDSFAKILTELPSPTSYAEALIMGRFKNGTPLALYGKSKPSVHWRSMGRDDKEFDVPFDYSHDPRGNKCPLGAHVRKMNSRKGGNSTPILRRGMLFSRTQDALKDRNYENSDGLLFISYQKSLKEQFFPLFERSGPPNSDWIVYRDRTNSDLQGSMSTTYGGEDRKIFYSPSLSKFVGGDFFYMPSPQFLLKHSAPLPL